MAATNATTGLFSALPQRLSALLFGRGKPVQLAADQVLYLADDAGDGCYRVEKGLLKVSMLSASGVERILAIFGPGLSSANFQSSTGYHGRPRWSRCATATSCL